MAFRFDVSKPLTADEEVRNAKIDLFLDAEKIRELRDQITDEWRSVEGMTELMTNIDKSLELLSKFGADAIPQLNIDHGLEEMMHLDASLITVEKAVEALEGDQKTFMQKLIDWIKSFLDHIGQLIRALLKINEKNCQIILQATRMVNTDDQVTMIPHPRAIRLVELHAAAKKIGDVEVRTTDTGKQLETLQNELDNLANEYNAVVDQDPETHVIKLKSDNYMRENITVQRAGYADVEIAKRLAKAWLDCVPPSTFENWFMSFKDRQINKSVRDCDRMSPENRQTVVAVIRLRGVLPHLMEVIQSQVARSMMILAKHCVKEEQTPTQPQQ